VIDRGDQDADLGACGRAIRILAGVVGCRDRDPIGPRAGAEALLGVGVGHELRSSGQPTEVSREADRKDLPVDAADISGETIRAKVGELPWVEIECRASIGTEDAACRGAVQRAGHVLEREPEEG
jgi:hypothetical protein